MITMLLPFITRLSRWLIIALCGIFVCKNVSAGMNDRVSIVLMMVAGAVFLFNYLTSNKPKTTKAVEKKDFLPKDKKKN